MKNLQLNLSFGKNRTETLNFKDFMKKKDDITNRSPIKRQDLTAYSLYINPLAFIDVNFILIAVCVVLVAICEKKLAENGFTFIASSISGILRIAFPVIAAGSLIYLISQSSFLLR